MRSDIALALLVVTAGVGVIAVTKTVEWSFSPGRRHRLAVKAHQKTVARHRATRRNP